MRKRNLIFFIFLAISFSSTNAQEVKVKKGDTLSQIANDYNISLREIMDANNLYSADKLRVGQIINLPKGAIKESSPIGLKYIVSKGDNIAKIASLYSIQENDIITINKLLNPDILYPGQVLLLPKEARKNISISSNFHIISKGETLYKISKHYNKSIEDLIAINSLEDPDNLSPGDKIFLKRPIKKQSNIQQLFQKDSINEWRQYGPLEINWSQWGPFEGSIIAPAIHKNGTPIYIAVNCNSSKLTWRGSNRKWEKWFTPTEDFEFTVLDQVCKNTK